MVKYRKIAICMWGDQKFKALSRPKPNAQTLWINLLTGEHTLAIPGLSMAGEYALAEALGWSISAFRRAFKELANKGMAHADWQNRVLWLPNAIKYNPPESLNVVKAWAKSVEGVPECELRTKGIEQTMTFLRNMDVDKAEAFVEAFVEALPKGIGLPKSEGIAYQEQEQEQEQEQLPPIVPLGGPSDSPAAKASAGGKKVVGGIQQTFDHWNTHGKQTVEKTVDGRKKLVRWHSHRKLSPEIVAAVGDRLKQYSVDELCQAIDNYATVLFGTEYFWSYPWPLYEFLTRKQGKEKGAPFQLFRFLPDNFDPEKYRLSGEVSGETQLADCGPSDQDDAEQTLEDAGLID